MSKLRTTFYVCVIAYAAIAYIGHVSSTAADTAWRLGCTSAGMSASECSVLQEKQQ